MNANYIYNVEYSEKAAAIAYDERNNAAAAKGMSEKNQTYLTNINAAISGAIIQQGGQEDDVLPLTHIRMKTSYPGVLIGTGSAHETGAKNEMLLGFTLDYVTGIPYLPGSSLKGLLRSAFHFGDSEKNETEYIRETLSAISEMDVSAEHVSALETALFANPDNGIVFLDSFIQGMTTDAGENAAYMGLDYITPHKGDMLKNPIPLPILRINPNVVFDFRFHLQDVKTEDGKVFQVDTIKNLFIEILKDFGIGAKTHVGYGVLEEYSGEIRRPAGSPVAVHPAQPVQPAHHENKNTVQHNDAPSRRTPEQNMAVPKTNHKVGYVLLWTQSKNTGKYFGFIDEDQRAKKGKYYFDERNLTDLNEDSIHRGLKVQFLPREQNEKWSARDISSLS